MKYETTTIKRIRDLNSKESISNTIENAIACAVAFFFAQPYEAYFQALISPDHLKIRESKNPVIFSPSTKSRPD
jgi:hypothetical protein